ncbi:FadR/GntR family transcriptional regulator [Microbacterium luticocti]|uniref:FadR/GntR family transcriptional regulator n=1 Tax=Microbacterium luticocti TaxID=451764 RepID=UPI00041F9447|nr:GntR family transcriptional regulator [Microbacterium luticocti]
MTTADPRATRMRRATVADQIKELILTRGLRPGDPLPTEAELCETLGVSRSSVREAMRTLSTLDIVDVRHGHGTFVGQMSLDPMVEALVFRGVLAPRGAFTALRDVVEVRLALDLALAERVVEAIAEHDSPELDDLVHQMEQRAQRGETFLEADRAFHTMLLATLDNRLVGQLVGAFWDVHTAVAPQLGIALPDDILDTARAHGDMLRAARAGDVDAYRAAVIEHYAPLQRSIAQAS